MVTHPSTNRVWRSATFAAFCEFGLYKLHYYYYYVDRSQRVTTKPNRQPVCRITQMQWIHSLVSISHFAKFSEEEKPPVSVWQLLINLLERCILQWWWNWKSGPESTSRTESPPMVNWLFKLAGNHNNKFQWNQLIPADRQTNRQTHKQTNSTNYITSSNYHWQE